MASSQSCFDNMSGEAGLAGLEVAQPIALVLILKVHDIEAEG